MCIFFVFCSIMKFFKPLCIHFKIPTNCIRIATRYKTINLYRTYNQLHKISPSKLSFSYQNLHRKYCFSYYKEDSDSENEENENKRDIKNVILPNIEDTLATQISECKSLQNIFDLLQHNVNQLNWKNISMAIAMVRELQIIYYRVYMFERNLQYFNTMEKNNFENILTNNDFLNILNLIEKNYEFMNIQCLSYTLLCLHKLEVNSTINKKISERLNQKLLATPIEEIEFCILSRYIVSFVDRKDLSALFTIKNIWPIILKKMC